MTTLISADSTILIVGIILVIVSVGVTLEQRYKWASIVGAVFICIFCGFLMTNLNIISRDSAALGGIDSIILLVSLPMFLFKADLRSIFKQTGKQFVIFHFAAVGSIAAALLAFLVFRNNPDMIQVLPVMTGGAVGGTVNCVAVGKIFGISNEAVSAYLAADNVAFLFMVLLLNLLHRTGFIKRLLPRPYTDKIEQSVDQEALKAEGKTLTAGFWGGKEISMKDMAYTLTASFMIIGVSQLITNFLSTLNLPNFVNLIFANQFMILTIITVALATIFPNFFGNLKGGMELGNIGFLMWFTVIGMFADLRTVLENGILVVFMMITVFLINMAFSIIGSKICKGTWEEAVMASMATIGGPSTCASIGASFGWSDAIIPGMLVGLWGYIIGNYCGVLVGTIVL